DRASKPLLGPVIGTISFAASNTPLSVDGFRTLAVGPHRDSAGFAFDEITLGQCLAKIDYLAFYEEGPLPATAIGKALERLVPVPLPHEQRATLWDSASL